MKKNTIAKYLFVNVLIVGITVSAYILIPLINTPSTNAAAVASCTPAYATRALNHTTLGNYGSNSGHTLNDIFGAPDGAVVGGRLNGVVDFDNIGSQKGFVEVGFAPNVKIVDETGNDVAIHLFDWNPTEQEDFEVFASQDGVVWVSIGEGRPGISHVAQPSVVSFDLAGKLPNASYIKISNLSLVTQVPFFEGPDIDAIEILHASCDTPQITCSNNSQCGANGLTGAPFCQSNNVFQNYKTFTCNNPGTANSFCSETTNSQLQNNCTGNQTCNNGSCSNNNQLSVETRSATNILNNSATLNGYLNNLGGDPSASVWFQWGPSTAYGFESNHFTQTAANPINATIANLSPNTVYHFRAVAQNGQGTVYGQDLSFTSGNTIYNAQVQTLPATNLMPNAATLNGQLLSLGGDTSARVFFQWGTSVSYNNQTTDQTQNIAGMYSQTIPNLSQGQTYHFRAAAITSAGTVYGSDLSFTTTSNNNNVNITCNSNADCGSNGFIGNAFCQSNNVFKTYKTYSCVNPGTTSSYCTNAQSDQLQTTCSNSQTCSNGNCVQNTANLVATCTASPSPAQTNQQVTYTANVTGGTGNYTYNWTGSCNGLSQNCSQTFQYPSSYTTFLSVTSGNQTVYTSCYVNVNQNCTPNASQRCSGNSVYNYDSCGTQGSLVQTCTGNQTCSNASCVNTCTSHASQRCVNNSVYWYDSCGTQQELSQTCNGNQICQNNQCVTNNTGSTFCPDNSPEVTVDSTNLSGNTFTLSGTSGVYKAEISSPVGLSDSQYNNYTWANWTNDTQARIHGGDVFMLKNKAVTFAQSSDGLRVQNADQKIGGGTHVDAPYNQSRKLTADWARGMYANVNLQTGDTLTFVVDAIKDKGAQGDFIYNRGSLHIKICPVQTQQAACNTNSDCGTSGYIDAAVCQNNNVYRNYKTYTCNNAGTSNAQCSNSTTLQLQQTCGNNQTCNNGSCTNVNVTCNTNSDCGTNGVTGSPFCQNGNVYQNYRTYTCNNPGTGNSQCSNATNAQLQTTCTGNQTCSNGSCSQNQNNLVVSCTGSPNPAQTNQQVTYTANATGGTGSYTYNWTGSCNGLSSSCSQTYQYANSYTTFLSVTSGTQTVYTSCYVNVNQNCTQNASQRCVGNNVYNYDSCGNQGSLSQTCNGNQTCNNGSCGTNNTCTYHSSLQCSGNSVYWYSSCGQQQDLYQICSGNQTCQNNQCVTTNQQQNFVVTKTVRNLSNGNLNWSNSVYASPSDTLQFNVTVQAPSGYSNQSGNSISVKDILPSNLSYKDNLTVDGSITSGDITSSGLIINNMSSGQTKTITYQVQVAPAQNFSVGTTTLINSVTVNNNGSNCGGYINCNINGSASASVIVTRTQILGGPTNISTGLTNNFLKDSFVLPLVLALLGVWLFTSGTFILPEGVLGRVNRVKEGFAQRKLQSKIAQIKKNEN